MRWCVIRHPELGAAVVGEDSLPVHEVRGWVVTSPLVDDQYSLNPADHPLPEPAAETAEQLAVDAGQSNPATDAKSASKTTKTTTQTSGS
jgi:hypothetical protein